MDALEASLPNMAGAALDSFEAASPCDMVLCLLLPAGHNIGLSLALLQKVADCKLECRAVQVFLSDAEADAPAVLTLYVIAKVFAGQSLMAGRVAESTAFKTMLLGPVPSKVSPSDCPRGTNGHLLWPTLLAKGFWPQVLTSLSVWPLKSGEALLEMEPCPFLGLASMDVISANCDSTRWLGFW